MAVGPDIELSTATANEHTLWRPPTLRYSPDSRPLAPVYGCLRGWTDWLAGLRRLEQVHQATAVGRSVTDHTSRIGQELNQAGQPAQAELKSFEILALRSVLRQLLVQHWSEVHQLLEVSSASAAPIAM